MVDRKAESMFGTEDEGRITANIDRLIAVYDNFFNDIIDSFPTPTRPTRLQIQIENAVTNGRGYEPSDLWRVEQKIREQGRSPLTRKQTRGRNSKSLYSGNISQGQFKESQNGND